MPVKTQRQAYAGNYGAAASVTKAAAQYPTSASRQQSAYDLLRRQGLTDAQIKKRLSAQAKPKTVVAKKGDTFDNLAEKLGVDTQALVKENPETPYPRAGEGLNVPPGVGVGAGIGDDLFDSAKRLWQKITPWDEAEGETFYEYAKPEPGGPGTPEWWTKNPVGRFFWDILGNGNDSEQSAPSGVGIGAGAMMPGSPPRQTAPSRPQANIRDFNEAEQALAYKDREARQMTGAYGVTNISQIPGYENWSDIYNPMYNPTPNLGARLEPGEYPRGMAPDRKPSAEYDTSLLTGPPGPGMGYDFQLPGSQDNLYNAMSEQIKDIYNQEPALRMQDWQGDILGLGQFETLGDKERISQIANEMWVKPLTVNYLNQFDGSNIYIDENGELAGEINWDNIPADDVQRLIDLGFLDTSAGGGGEYYGGGKYYYPGGGYGGGGYASAGQRPVLRDNPTYLGLVSWSI